LERTEIRKKASITRIKASGFLQKKLSTIPATAASQINKWLKASITSPCIFLAEHFKNGYSQMPEQLRSYFTPSYGLAHQRLHTFLIHFYNKSRTPRAEIHPADLRCLP